MKNASTPYVRQHLTIYTQQLLVEFHTVSCCSIVSPAHYTHHNPRDFLKPAIQSCRAKTRRQLVLQKKKARERVYNIYTPNTPGTTSVERYLGNFICYMWCGLREENRRLYHSDGDFNESSKVGNGLITKFSRPFSPQLYVDFSPAPSLSSFISISSSFTRFTGTHRNLSAFIYISFFNLYSYSFSWLLDYIFPHVSM